MTNAKESFNALKMPDGVHVEPCPCCGGRGELYEFLSDRPTQKVVMCATNESFGPQDSFGDCGCPLFMATKGHYQPTIREAVKYWNEYSKALAALQRKNRWRSHQVLRGGAA